MNICTIDGCNKRVAGRGLCNMHWARWRRNGDPLVRSNRASKAAFYLDWLERHKDHVGDDCLTWPFVIAPSARYVLVALPGRRNVMVHRAMCELAHGPAPADKPQALHSCGNADEFCVNPKHLRWGTHQENMDDKATHGTGARGIGHGMAKLTEELVHHIRERARHGATARSLAAEIGVTRQCISNVIARRTWTHV